MPGRAWKFGDNIDTDRISPGRYASLTDPQEYSEHCLEGVDPSFAKNASHGDVIVAGENFGCGSSRERAPVSIKAIGISCVIASSFARTFLRNSINIGLPILECPEASEGIESGDLVDVDLAIGRISDLTTGYEFRAKPIPEFLAEIMAAGGLVGWARIRLGLDPSRA